MLGKIESKRRRGWQRTRWLDGITDSMEVNLSKLLEIVKDRGAWHVAVQGVPESRTRLSDCMTTATQEKRRPSLEHACCPNYLPVINSILPSVRSPWPVRRCLPAALSVPTLSLLFVLNRLTPFCNTHVWKFFSNSCLDYLNIWRHLQGLLSGDSPPPSFPLSFLLH